MPVSPAEPLSFEAAIPPPQLAETSPIIALDRQRNPNLTTALIVVATGMLFKSAYECIPLGFPGGPKESNLSANAGDMSSTPSLGRLHLPRGKEAWEPQLLKPERLDPVLCDKRSHNREKLNTTVKNGPCSLLRENTDTPQQRSGTAKTHA
ncbi:hypothetical protein R6Z07F_001989 [Ovis aries]